MKAYVFAISMALCCVLVMGLSAQSVPADLENLDYPIASVEDHLTPYVNPALLGNEQISGFAYSQNLNKENWIKQHWFFVNLGNTSYIYENRADNSFHSLADGIRLADKGFFQNVYAGTRYTWMNSEFSKGKWRSGLTFRPHNSSSLAMTWDNPYKDSPSYKAGIALRPLAWFMPQHSYRLELSGDIGYKKNPTEKKYEITKPMIGINTQILDGLMIGGSYNLDTENAMLNFGLRFGKTALGTSVVKPKEGDTVFLPSISLNEYSYKPFFGIVKAKWHDLKMKGSLVSYKAPEYELGPFKIYDSKTETIEELIARLDRIEAEPGVKGIVLINPSFSTSFALQEELVRAIARFKSSGKKVECYYDNISNGGYIFASAIADNISLNPMGIVDLHGLNITSPYFATLLDSLGVDVLNFRSHKYKSAGNQFSESSMTDAEREVYDAILGSIYEKITQQIATGRGDRLKGSVEDIINAGPYFLAQDALDAGLVDKLIYEDEMDDHLNELYGFKRHCSKLSDFTSYDWYIPSSQKIAVIYASGNIVMGKGTPGKMIAAESTVKLIRKARKNPEYKGIILRVDSGGGSAQASDIILRELELAQTKNKKPVVVSMAGVAASGGYYIACKADRIIAEETTLTGSIGVIGIAFNAERMFNKIRVNWSTVKKGKNADFPSIYRKWSEEEKERMTAYIEATYEDFVRLVDEGRENLNLEQVHEYAQGRVWTGKQALALGLIDKLGGMDTAIEEMRELTGIKGKLTLVDATTSASGIDVNISKKSLINMTAHPLLSEIEESYIRLYEFWKQYQGQNALMLAPVSSQIIDF